MQSRAIVMAHRGWSSRRKKGARPSVGLVLTRRVVGVDHDGSLMATPMGTAGFSGLVKMRTVMAFAGCFGHLSGGRRGDWHNREKQHADVGPGYSNREVLRTREGVGAGRGFRHATVRAGECAGTCADGGELADGSVKR